MPELPEVETIVQGLSSVLKGKTVATVEVRKQAMWRGRSADELKGKSVLQLRRMAKLILIDFSANLTVAIHLKMTGQLIYVDKQGDRIVGGHPDEQFMAAQPSKYSHIIFHFTNISTLYFNDMRQFGYVHLLPSSEVSQLSFVSTLGIDPLKQDFTPDYLYEQLHQRPKTTVKQVMMDQTVIAGIGNIYADESLFDARLLPMRKASSITEKEALVLHQSIIAILQKAIHYGGTSYKDYVHHNGQKGTMQDHLLVYRRHGSPCKRCGTTLKRTTVGGRGTHYCPHCQT